MIPRFVQLHRNFVSGYATFALPLYNTLKHIDKSLHDGRASEISGNEIQTTSYLRRKAFNKARSIQIYKGASGVDVSAMMYQGVHHQ